VLATVVGLATAVVFPIVPQPENVFRIAPEQVTVVVSRIARGPGQVIALLAEQTDPLEAVISEEVVIASAIAVSQAVPGQEIAAASEEVPEASAGARHAPAAAGALPAWAVVVSEAAAVAAAVLEVVVAVVVAGGSKS
jgi:hypothetical protein